MWAKLCFAFLCLLEEDFHGLPFFFFFMGSIFLESKICSYAGSEIKRELSMQEGYFRTIKQTPKYYRKLQ